MRAYHYTEVPAEPAEGRPGVSLRWAIGRNVGAPNFALRVIDIQPHCSTAHHAHSWEHEVFVLEGQGVVHSDEGDAAIGPGMCVYTAPDELHQFEATGEVALRIICVIPYPPGIEIAGQECTPPR